MKLRWEVIIKIENIIGYCRDTDKWQALEVDKY